MSSHVPPELMTPEDRAARADLLRWEIQREWVRFAIVEGILVWLPFIAFAVLYVAGVFSDSALIPGAIVAGAAMVALITYWLLARILPRSRELGRLEGG